MAKKFNKNSNNFNKIRINDELKIYPEVRLVYQEHSGNKGDNDFTKVVEINKAFKLAEEYELDLVEIKGGITPPVVRLCDYSKYLYEQKKNAKQKNKNVNTVKEIQLSVNIGLHDLEIKANRAKEFIKNGDKVKVVLTMRGRELSRREYSKDCFNKFTELLSDVAVFENQPRDEGNKVICIFKRK